MFEVKTHNPYATETTKVAVRRPLETIKTIKGLRHNSFDNQPLIVIISYAPTLHDSVVITIDKIYLERTATVAFFKQNYLDLAEGGLCLFELLGLGGRRALLV